MEYQHITGDVMDNYTAGMKLPKDQARFITKERAEQIWSDRDREWSLPTMTPEEVRYVANIWETMPGNTCFMDAFFRVLSGVHKD